MWIRYSVHVRHGDVATAFGIWWDMVKYKRLADERTSAYNLAHQKVERMKTTALDLIDTNFMRSSMRLKLVVFREWGLHQQR